MFFSHLARILAALAFLVGIYKIGLGISIAQEWLLPYEEALARYAPGAKGSGALIDRGFYTLIVAVVLGALAEVSFRLRQMQRDR
ncbi:hypothetical protein [Agrobacterium sp. LAD9]|uniref:hypothetical protein n=1 Tax=Agrobacterium sp. LAD9 TaxID=2055153 RepID=UPI000D1F75F7|nr:hypothetical protein [Agrobacterium sp. LAD9]